MFSRIKLVGGVSSTDRANYIRGLTEQLRVRFIPNHDFSIGQAFYRSKKWIPFLSSYSFQLAFLIYDSGVIGDDKQLANALWRRFLDGSNPKPEQIELLVSYVRRTLSALDHIDINSLVMTGRFTWLTLKEEKFKV